MIISSRAFKEFDPTERLYCSAAVAILGAGAIGGAASIYGASKAADAQTQAAQAAIANQQKMYGLNQAQLQPFIDAGGAQIGNQLKLLDPNDPTGPLAALMKLTTPGADMSAELAKTPGYEFSLSQGLRGANNALAARGLGGSGGAVAKGATNFAEGLAGNTWQSVVAALQNQFATQTSAGQNLINSGQGAASALAGVGTNTANQISGSLTGAGNAQAAGYNAIGSGVQNFSGQVPSAILLQQLLAKNGGGGGSSGGIYNNSGGSSVGDPTQLNSFV